MSEGHGQGDPIEEAGEVVEDAGHMHVMIDVGCVTVGEESVGWLDIPGDGRADGQSAPSLIVTGGSQPTGEADEIPGESLEEPSSPVWPALAGLIALVGVPAALATHRRGAAARRRDARSATDD